MDIYRFMEIYRFMDTCKDFYRFLRIHKSFSKIQLYFGDVKLAS